MPKYHVDVEMTDTFQVTIEAKNQEEAVAFALETLAEMEDPVGSDYHSYCSGFEATNCVEADGEAT
ncbi:hypothetical protein A3731_40865 [Roseovarius sp. HI0049]|nr:hypothetical protein A3731_43290 [Roseovarius sp. HI0049]KZY38117.1 hypothetical protein A3731_40865 [Roseovarius sp. HI0049]